MIGKVKVMTRLTDKQAAAALVLEALADAIDAAGPVRLAEVGGRKSVGPVTAARIRANAADLTRPLRKRLEVLLRGQGQYGGRTRSLDDKWVADLAGALREAAAVRRLRGGSQ